MIDVRRCLSSIIVDSSNYLLRYIKPLLQTEAT
jgi:hypothetical protein